VGDVHIRTDDLVEVIAGNDKGTRGKVLSVHTGTARVVVEGVNKVYKHVRRSQKNPQGGRLNKEMPIQLSNVMIICPKTNKPTRIGIRYLADGSKERYSKRSGASLGIISPPRTTYAKKG
jgi:large subunit ribosomal protein L24